MNDNENENLLPSENCGESSRAGSDPARDKTVEIRHWIRKLGMEKFFAGMVWVMNEVLFNSNVNANSNSNENENFVSKKSSNLTTLARPSGTLSLERTSNLGIKPDERLGRFILQEIMQGGNFGHHDERLKGVNEMGFWKRWKHFLQVSIVRARYFPTEVLWSYVFRMRIGIWRKTGIEI